MTKILTALFAISIVFALTLPVMALETEIAVDPVEITEETTVTLTAKTFGSGAYGVDCWLIGEIGRAHV